MIKGPFSVLLLFLWLPFTANADTLLTPLPDLRANWHGSDITVLYSRLFEFKPDLLVTFFEPISSNCADAVKKPQGWSEVWPEPEMAKAARHREIVALLAQRQLSWVRQQALAAQFAADCDHLNAAYNSFRAQREGAAAKVIYDNIMENHTAAQALMEEIVFPLAEAMGHHRLLALAPLKVCGKVGSNADSLRRQWAEAYGMRGLITRFTSDAWEAEVTGCLPLPPAGGAPTPAQKAATEIAEVINRRMPERVVVLVPDWAYFGMRGALERILPDGPRDLVSLDVIFGRQ